MPSKAEIAKLVFREPWLLHPETHQMLMLELIHGMGFAEDGEELPDVSADARLPKHYEWWNGEKEEINYFLTMEEAPGVARVPLNGIVAKRLSRYAYYWLGAACLDRFVQGLQQAAAKPEIHTIAVDINSPGGVVTFVEETGRAIERVARESGKRVLGFTDTQACSSAYWILASCPKIYCTPSSQLGCIGTYMYSLDHSEALRKAGIKEFLFEAGRHKGANAGVRPYTKEEEDIYQGIVDAVHAKFKAAVGRLRPGVPEDAMEGLWYFGEEAWSLGLADDLVDGYDDMLRAEGLIF